MRLSHSRLDIFNKCKRQFYFQYIKEIVAVGDMRYARRGNVFHSCAEFIIKNEKATVEQVKEKFEQVWKEKKLDEDFKEKKDETYVMILNFFNSHPLITSTELMVLLSAPEFVGYLDSVNTNIDEIYDWKTSTFMTGKSEIEYKDQLGRYAYLYYRKFGRMAKKCIVYFVKYFPVKTVEYIFNEDDIFKYEQEMFNTNKYIEENKGNIEAFPRCKDQGFECNVFCPYGNECDNKIKFVLNISGNYIKIDGEISEKLNIGLERKFSYELKNAIWIKKQYPQANTTIMLWKRNKQMLPIGFLTGLLKTLNDYAKHIGKELIIEYNDIRQCNGGKVIMPDKFINGKEMRDYQRSAINKFLEYKVAGICAGTGSGKSEIAIELIRQLNWRTLFIVDKKGLLLQTKQRIEDSLGIKVGQIGDGTQEIENVTVATIQTLIKRRKELEEYLSTIRFVIFDEAHHAPSKSYVKISSYLNNTEYRLGMSATLHRDDGNDMMLEAVFGSKVVDLSSKVLIQNGWLMKPQILFYKYPIDEDVLEQKSKEGLINEDDNYAKFYESFISKNEQRNIAIMSLVNPNEKTLILVKLVEHGKLLEQMIPNSIYVHGETTTDERKEVFVKFVSGEIKTIIGTIGIFSEGLDFPHLEVAINAAANKGNIKTVQILGRILRKLEGKNNAKYIDFVDGSKFFKSASKARRNILLKEGHDVEVLEIHNI
jgi:superfamily II DNA or RNA helicase